MKKAKAGIKVADIPSRRSGRRASARNYRFEDSRSLEILREVQVANEKNRKVLSTQYSSSSDRGRIAALKKRGFVKKEGKEFGHGGLTVTQAGKQLLRRAPRMTVPAGKGKYTITIKGPGMDVSFTSDQIQRRG